MPSLHSLADAPPQAPPPLASRFTNTARPALTSGFGAVLARERDLQDATDAYLRVEDSTRAPSLRHVLLDQSSQLGGNIALLEQRYDALPHPGRVRGSGGRLANRVWPAPEAHIDPLCPLIVRHRDLLADIAALITDRADGQRGALILTEVARSHEEMAGRLTSLASPDDVAMNPDSISPRPEITASPNGGR